MENETLVVVSFYHLEKEKKYLATVEPDSREVHAVDMETETIVDSEPVEEPRGRREEFEEEYQDEYSFEKTVKVSSWMLIGYEEHKPLWHWQSRQTIHGPNQDADIKREYVKAVYEGDTIPKDIAVLSNDDQELMAERRLRERLDGFRLGSGRGGGLQYIDILGSTETDRVVASVTYSSYENDRIEAVNSFADDSRTYFFARGRERPEDLADDIEYVPLQRVFDWMDTDGTRRQESLHVMLGYQD